MTFGRTKFAALGMAALLMAATGRAAEGDGDAMDRAIEDLRGQMGAMSAQVNTLADKDKKGLKIEGFTDLRYDDFRKPALNSGLEGIYVRRAEIKLHGEIAWAKYSAGYDFTENKMKDMGLEIPFEMIKSELRIGQYRQPWGIVTQTSSSKINLSERPQSFGGTSQIGAPALIKERGMGLQLRNKMDIINNFLGIEAQAGILNQKDTDQAAGINKIQVGAAPATGNNTAQVDDFKTQVTDNDFSSMGRLALIFSLPGKTKLQLGGEAARDSRNSVWYATAPATQVFDEFQGAEFLFSTMGMLTVQAEWVRGLLGFNGATGLASESNGWYSDMILDLMPLINGNAEKGDALELIARVEESMSNATSPTREFNQVYDGVAGGVKWSYWGGMAHTQLSFHVQALNGQFGGTVAGGPTSMLILQQQYKFGE